MLKCKEHRRSAEDRDAWRRRIEETKAQVGLKSQRRRRLRRDKADVTV
jgi:hypothetical protein